MKRGRIYFRLFLSIAIILSILIIIANIAIYSYYVNIVRSISASASNNGVLSLFVESDGAPNIAITYPENTTYTSHVTELDYTVSDNSLRSCWYSLDNGVTNVSITCGNNVTGITSSEGSNTWRIYANDSRGDRNLSSVTFVVSISSAAPSSGGGGGGGGGAAAILPKSFDVEPSELNIFAVSGEQITREIKLINTGKTGITINISLSGIGEIAKLNSNQITLDKGEEKVIVLSMKAPKEGISAGRVIFNSGSIEKEVFVLINVRSEKKLFDVSLTSPESKKVISLGENLNTFVSLTQVGPPGEIDVSINYIIKNFNGDVLSTESESFSVYETKGYIKEFKTVELGPGDYIAGIELIYPGGFATSSIHFRIVKRIINYQIVIAIILAILAALIILYSILMYIKAGRRLKDKTGKKQKR